MIEDALRQDAFQDFDLSSSPLEIMDVDSRAAAQAALDAACVIVIAEQHATQTMHDVMYKTDDYMHTPPPPLHFHPPRQVRRTRLLSKRKTKKNVVWMPQSAVSAVAHLEGIVMKTSKTPTLSRVINLTYPALEPASRSCQTTSRTRFVREYACFEDTTHRASV